MDFVNNSSPQQAAQTQAPQQAHKQILKMKKSDGKTMRIMNVIILVLGALIIGLIALYVAVGGSKAENKYVDNSKFQAVFLNGGQVYFGKIHSLNSKFITVDNIYYLRVNQQVQPNQTATANTAAANQDVSLAKLGCELHGPTDVMIINRDQVLFWENLKTDGQVSKAISDYVKANPKGQDCTTAAGTGTTTPAATPTKK
jgi:flagellar basal body-associated protein FliL